MTIGERLRRVREARKLSQSTLARKARVSRVTLNRIEQGHQVPSLGTVERIARALRVKARALLPG